MPRWLPVALALSVLLNAFFVAGFIFRGWIAPLPFEQRLPPPPGSRPNALEAVANEVNLDERQRQMLRGVLEQHGQARHDRWREMQRVREQIVAEYRRIPLDPSRLGPLFDKLGDLRADQQKETLSSLIKIEQQLTPDQRERMHQVLVDRILSSPWSRQPRSPPPRPSQ
jgi:Spy/CpxP family protein refolding chaperone